MFLNVNERCSRATISRMLRHRVPPKDSSNVQAPWSSTEPDFLRSEKFRGCTCPSSAVLKIPTMLCARTNFQIFGGNHAPFQAGPPHMMHTCTPVSLFHNSSFSEARKDSCLASEASDSEDMCYQAIVLNIEKHPMCGITSFARAAMFSGFVGQERNVMT